MIRLLVQLLATIKTDDYDMVTLAMSAGATARSLEHYLNYLADNRYICVTNSTRGSRRYKLTKKGERFLEDHERIVRDYGRSSPTEKLGGSQLTH